MKITTPFRRRLARQLLQIAALALPACSDLSGTTCGGPIGAPFEVCFDPTGGDAGAAPDGGALAACPTGDDLIAAIIDAALPKHPGSRFFTKESGPTRSGEECCYVVQQNQDCTGRPFLVADRPVAAPPRAGLDGWSDAAIPAPRVEGLGAEARDALAAAWMSDGLGEHASVASFGRFALELLALGAPAELVARAHQAALDEVRHARLCFALASAYAGTPLGPGAFPFAGAVEVAADLATFAARTAREGCIAETLAAVHAEEELQRTSDPAVRAVLASIADDEARHAELAWRTVAWAIRTGGAPVRDAVAEAFAALDGEDELLLPAARALLT